MVLGTQASCMRIQLDSVCVLLTMNAQLDESRTGFRTVAWKFKYKGTKYTCDTGNPQLRYHHSDDAVGSGLKNSTPRGGARATRARVWGPRAASASYPNQLAPNNQSDTAIPWVCSFAKAYIFHLRLCRSTIVLKKMRKIHTETAQRRSLGNKRKLDRSIRYRHPGRAGEYKYKHKIYFDTGQTRNKLLAQWVHLKKSRSGALEARNYASKSLYRVTL